MAYSRGMLMATNKLKKYHSFESVALEHKTIIISHTAYINAMKSKRVPIKNTILITVIYKKKKILISNNQDDLPPPPPKKRIERKPNMELRKVVSTKTKLFFLENKENMFSFYTDSNA